MDVLTERTCPECHGTGCIAGPGDCGECDGTGSVPAGPIGEVAAGPTTASTESRIVSFDLMPKDPDYYFVLTEALREFEARQRAEAEGAEDADDFGVRLRWAETAQAALDRIEKAMSAPATRSPA